ncbi:FecR family protein [Pinibacter soli]|uniref:FecR domain-containing protein n=1 Tax=Pinibacter soli TaxID=3044211 RepID=A0ABT6RGL1_9BACT|nr:FecR family protein [Pinibacter soli]MDI3320987.1 FecR domain-containing protein [Pinibacter soli]
MGNESTPNNDLQHLIEKYVNKTYSKEELQRIVNEAANGSDELFAALKALWDKAENRNVEDQAHWNELFSSMMERSNVLESAEGRNSEEDKEQLPRIGRRRRFIARTAVAAAVILVVSTTLLILYSNKKQQVAVTPQTNPEKNILPGGDKAILTLADGSKIVLDTASNGTLAQQGGSKVIKIGGQISYEGQQNAGQVLYNTISTPKGGQYQLELPDGSKVWLNASSSLKFPTAFVGKERDVELSGEGYFDISHNAKLPFHVRVNDLDVRVLGTQFNVNAYDDEPSLKTTLIDGSVIVSSQSLKKASVLKPGQQGVLNKNELSVNKDVDIEEVVAWKNGQFMFTSTRLDQIMKQISRWYDVEVEFQGHNQDRVFSGIVGRGSNISEVLDIMRRAGIKFQIQGRKITVLQ